MKMATIRVVKQITAIIILVTASARFASETNSAFSLRSSSPVPAVERKHSVTATTTKNKTATLVKSNNSNWRSLYFVHITKTGGTSIEAAGAQAGIAWGMCVYIRKLVCQPLLTTNHETVPPMIKRKYAFNRTAAVDARFLRSNAWHVPHYLLQLPSSIPTFAVVRHPYTRAISEYNCPWSGYKGPDRENPQRLNTWLQTQLSAGGGMFHTGVSFYPQHKYVFDSRHHHHHHHPH